MPLLPYKIEAQNTPFTTTSHRVLHAYINLSNFSFILLRALEVEIQNTDHLLTLFCQRICLLAYYPEPWWQLVAWLLGVFKFLWKTAFCWRLTNVWRGGKELKCCIHIIQVQFICIHKNTKKLQVIYADSLFRFLQCNPFLRPAGLTTWLILCVLAPYWR